MLFWELCNVQITICAQKSVLVEHGTLGWKLAQLIYVKSDYL